jgi:hypothetical protein
MVSTLVLWAVIGLFALLPIGGLALSARRLGTWPTVLLGLLDVAVEADVLSRTIGSANAFQPLVAVATLVALLALLAPAVALADAVRLTRRLLRGGALPPVDWSDVAAAVLLGVGGYAMLGAGAGLFGLCLAFALWAGREPAPAAEM